ncbi:MAG: hypothetical protein ACL93V_15315 [Candidatus Electrothrix sp. YB6]
MQKILFGRSENTTLFLGKDNSKGISRIYIDDTNQIAPNEFKFTLNRFGEINQMKKSDYQESINKIFKKE